MLKSLGRVLVLDFSKLLPGPFCSMILADLGCRVIRVELPYWRDMLRDVPPKIDGQGYAYWIANRNKESLALDYRKPEGLKALLRLVKKADVLLEGFRPGLMERLGLGFKTLSKLNRRLIYCSITGYGQRGPMSAKAGHDINFLAQAGFLGLGDSSGEIAFPSTQVADLSGSLYGAIGILAALLDRSKTGRGQPIDIAMAEAAHSLLPLAIGQHLAGRPPKVRGQWWNGTHPFYRVYRTQDGRHMAVGALEKGFALALLDAVGRPELKERLDKADWTDMPQDLHRELEAVFASRTQAEWTAALEGKDVCVNPVATLEEALAGRTHPGSPIRLSQVPFKVRRPPPMLGADSARVLKSLGFSVTGIRRLKAEGLLP